jgi:xanthine dehydrogenase iron-sulfur cluster and FAD-binding subunit A
MASGNLVFALNGERVELQGVDPSGTLIEYLRLHSKYKGTKLACGEGALSAISTCDAPFQLVVATRQHFFYQMYVFVAMVSSFHFKFS